MKKTKKNTPSKLPKNQWWRMFFSATLICAWVLVAAIASQFVVGFLLMWWIGKEALSQPIWSAIFSALSYALTLALTVIVPMKLFKKWHVTRKDLGLSGLPTWTDMGLAPIGFVASSLLAALFVWFFSMFSWFNAEEVQEVGFNFLVNPFDRIIAFITLVIIAPIAEEVIFRGWLYGLIRKKSSLIMSSVWSIVISSLVVSCIFGLVHFQWNVAVNVFAMSLVLCVLREITGTIYAGIVTHMIKNGVAFWLLYIVGMS